MIYFQKAAQQIKSLGYRVFVPKGYGTYGYFSDGKHIGNFQRTQGGILLSTVNTEECAKRLLPISRFNFEDAEPLVLFELTKERLSEALADYPKYVDTLSKRPKIAKYKDLADFLNNFSLAKELKEI